MHEARPLTANSQFAHDKKSSGLTKASAPKSDHTSPNLDSTPPEVQSIGMSQRIPGLKRPSALSLPPMRQTGPVEQGTIGLSSNRPPFSPPFSPAFSSQLQKGLSSPLDSPDARWSWTNSQAPSTPRIAPPNTRPSLTGRSVRSVTSWFRGQESEDRPPSVRSHRRKRSNPLLLKNQALRPVLAPRPAVKRPVTALSNKSGRLSGPLASGRSSKASHREEDQRPLTPLARSMSGLSQ